MEDVGIEAWWAGRKSGDVGGTAGNEGSVGEVRGDDGNAPERGGEVAAGKNGCEVELDGIGE